MTVGILGLGLIGGSLARAYKLAGHTVYVKNRDSQMFSFAMLSGAVDGRLDEETIPGCDLILQPIHNLHINRPRIPIIQMHHRYVPPLLVSAVLTVLAQLV